MARIISDVGEELRLRLSPEEWRLIERFSGAIERAHLRISADEELTMLQLFEAVWQAGARGLQRDSLCQKAKS